MKYNIYCKGIFAFACDDKSLAIRFCKSLLEMGFIKAEIRVEDDNQNIKTLKF